MFSNIFEDLFGVKESRHDAYEILKNVRDNQFWYPVQISDEASKQELARRIERKSLIEMYENKQITELLSFFEYSHLPEKLQDQSKKFYTLAHDLDKTLTDSHEKVAMLRKLLEAKDCAVRARMQ